MIATMLLLISCAAAISIGNENIDHAKIGGRNLVKTGSPGETSARRRSIVIIGASYARGWTDFLPRNITIINKGVNGEQSFEMLARFRKDVVDEHPDVVIIWGFINDIFRSTRVEIDPTLERTRRSIAEMVDLARANGIKPIIATEVTIRGRSGIKEAIAAWIGRITGVESYQDYVNRQVLITNQWTREFAREKGIALLDFQPLLADGEGRRKKEYAKDDGSHLSEAAYTRLSRYAEAYISQ